MSAAAGTTAFLSAARPWLTDPRALAEFVSRVTPPSSSWGLEVDPCRPGLPDFGCAIDCVSSDLGADLGHERSVTLLRALLGPDHFTGQLFFELDARDEYSRGAHAFARLSSAVRTPSAFAALLLSPRAPRELGPVTRGAAALAGRLSAGAQISDAGIVIRGDAPELRIGVTARDRNDFFALLGTTTESDSLIEAVAALWSLQDERAPYTIQLAIVAEGVAPRVTGVEAAHPDARGGWGGLFSRLVELGAIDSRTETRLLGWPARERVVGAVGEPPWAFTRSISHVKLVPGSRVSAKVYLAASITRSLFL